MNQFINMRAVGGLLACVVVLPASAWGHSGVLDVQVALWGSQLGGVPTCVSDLNGDGIVGPADLAQVLGAWGPNPGNPADLNGDGVVGPPDLAQVLGAWGPCGLPNDDCADALPIGDGQTAYSTVEATTDGMSHADQNCQYDGQTYNDIWYDYTASCSGTLTVTTCEQADYDTDLVVYRDCSCDGALLGCNDDDFTQDCGAKPDFHSTVRVPVEQGSCYKIRVGGFSQLNAGTGMLTVSCDVGGACPGDGDCCGPNGTPGCEDPNCCSLVCGGDPFCCDVTWDAVCADAAALACPDLCAAGPSDCCIVHDLPGCDTASCEQEVCRTAPFCCGGTWDLLCVQLAAALCPAVCP